MSNKSIGLSDALHGYLCDTWLREPPAAAALRKVTTERADANMQIAPEQGQFMTWLWRSLRARQGIEVGVYTGYSALCSALALPQDGRLLACDINADTAAIGKPYWQQAGVAGRIDLRIAPALETLDGQIADGQSGCFDFAFIDADKEGYIDYYERCLVLLRGGGVIAVDNVLWNGRVADPADDDETTVAIRAFNAQVAADDRVDVTTLPLADGLTLARKC
ncbi:MAG: class I SAM-dependent methyltransferase [Salinisphaera sp.]|nr:class I SAM-dependent methyltransferase [Salinisphaera sp.]